MQVKTVTKIIGRLYQATCVALDKLLIGEEDWKWVGQADILFRRQIEIGDINYVAEVSVDRESRPAYLGSFGNQDMPGAIECADGSFYYPAISESRLVTDMVAKGMRGRQACREARRILECRMHSADTLGSTWFLYTLTVKAMGNELPLAQISLSGIEAQLQSYSMDPRIDDLFYRLLKDAQQDAQKAVAQMNVRRYSSIQAV